MKRTSCYVALVLLALGLTLTLGCKPKTGPVAGADSEIAQVAQQLPEGTNALAAFDQKDYEAAVKGLVAIQQAITTPEQQAAFMTLKQHFKSKLLDAAATDPKANEALNGLRMLTQGR